MNLLVPQSLSQSLGHGSNACCFHFFLITFILFPYLSILRTFGQFVLVFRCGQFRFTVRFIWTKCGCFVWKQICPRSSIVWINYRQSCGSGSILMFRFGSGSDTESYLSQSRNQIFFFIKAYKQIVVLILHMLESCPFL